MVAKGRIGPHHRVEFEDRSSGEGAVSPEPSSQPLVAVEGPSQPRNPLSKLNLLYTVGFVSISSFLILEMPNLVFLPQHDYRKASLMPLSHSLLPHVQGRRQNCWIREKARAGKQNDHNCICRKPLMFPGLRGPMSTLKPPTGKVLGMSQAWSGKGLHPSLSEAEATTISSNATPPTRAGLLPIIQGGQRAAGSRK